MFVLKEVCSMTKSIPAIHFFYGSAIIFREYLKQSIRQGHCLFHNTYCSHLLKKAVCSWFKKIWRVCLIEVKHCSSPDLLKNPIYFTELVAEFLLKNHCLKCMKALAAIPLFYGECVYFTISQQRFQLFIKYSKHRSSHPEVFSVKGVYRRTPMPKCDFNKVAKQLYWNQTSAWVFSCKFAAYFQNNFS